MGDVEVFEDVEQRGAGRVFGIAGDGAVVGERHVVEVEALDLVFKQRGVERIHRHVAVGLEPERGFLKARDGAEGLDGAADVPHTHAIERLAQEVEAAQALRLRLVAAGPSGGSDATRADVGHAPFEVREHLFLLLKGGIVLRRAGEDFDELAKAGVVGGAEFIPTRFIEHIERDELEIFRAQAIAMHHIEPQAVGGLAVEIIRRHANAIDLGAVFLLRIDGGDVLGPAVEDFVFEVLHPRIALLSPICGIGGGRRGLGHGDEGFVGLGVDLVLRQFGEDTQGGGLDALFGTFIQHRHGVSAFEVALEPMKRADVQWLQVFVRTFGHLEAEVGLFAEQGVEPAHVLVDAEDAVDGEDGVFVRVHDEQRARSSQRDHALKVPAVGVHEEHAVAVAFHAAVDDLIDHVGDACRRCADFDAIIQRGDPPGISAATAAAGDAEARLVHLLAGFQIIERTDAAPGLKPSGRVTAREPPPAAFAEGAVVLAANLAELHGVDDEAGVTVPRVPHAVVLIARFVAHANAVFHDIGMAADVEDGGQRFVHLGRQVEIGCDVKSRHGLEVQLFHHVAVAFQLAGLGGLKRRFFRQGGQPHHVKQLAAVFRGLGLPIGSGLDLR